MIKNGSKKIEKCDVLLTGPHPPPSGGIATFCQTLMDKMSETEVIIEHPKFSINYHKETYFGRIYSRIIIYFRFFLLLIKRSPEIIHVNTASYNNFYFNSVFLILSKIAFKKTILHIHGGGFKKFYGNSNVIKRFIIKSIMKSSNVIITLSEQWKQFFNYIINNDNIEVIPNAIDLKKFENIGKYCDRRRKLINISFLGNINKAKGILDIFKAVPLVVNQYEDCRFNFAGIIASEIDNECKEMESCNNVIFYGEIFGERKFKFLSSADIFILPSYTEGLPIAMLEAMASKLPVIATTVGAIPEIIEENKNGYLISPGDYKDLAEKILILAKDKNLRDSMGRNNIKKMRHQYDVKNINEKILNLYKKLLSL